MSEDLQPYGAGTAIAPATSIDNVTQRWVEVTGEDPPKEVYQLEPAMVDGLMDIFVPLAQQVDQLTHIASGITVEDEFDVEGMQEARQMRIEIKKVRTNADNRRKEQKNFALVTGRCIDGIAKMIEQRAEAIETKMKELETTAERADAKRKYDLRMEREKLLIPYVFDITQYKLDEMTEEAFNMLLTGSRLAHELKQEQEAQAAEAARLEREAELDRQLAIHEENKRLRAEADKARAEAQALRAQEAERERVQAQQAAAEAIQKAAMHSKGNDKVRLKMIAGKLETFATELPTFDDPKIGEEITERLANVFAYIKATSETL